MGKQISIILLALPLLGMSMYSAESKECVAEKPSRPPHHWSYRLIDGRKCWYEGENNFPKALLQWPEQTKALSAFDQAEPPKERAQAVIPQSDPRNEAPESFEDRWGPLEAGKRRDEWCTGELNRAQCSVLMESSKTSKL
jgi:hypothetical protein